MFRIPDENSRVGLHPRPRFRTAVAIQVKLNDLIVRQQIVERSISIDRKDNRCDRARLLLKIRDRIAHLAYFFSFLWARLTRTQNSDDAFTRFKTDGRILTRAQAVP